MGDCGKQLGLWYAITGVACVVPIVNWFAGIAALVLLILSIVKYPQLKDQIPA